MTHASPVLLPLTLLMLGLAAPAAAAPAPARAPAPATRTAAAAADAAADDARPRRVLMVHSFGSSAPPFTTHSTAFESAIKRELGAAAVDLDEISLNMARYAQPDMEEAFAEFIGKRMAVWQPDVVVPVGSPAGRFVAKYRDRLFPRAPVVYTGMDRRTLPADAFADNATFVGESFDLAGLVEDMLQLDPQTSHVVVILGATPLERYWAAEFQRAFEPFAGRIKFTWANDLSFEQMLDLVSRLPPHSFVLLGLLMRDASGVTYNSDAALARLSAASAAPINGMFQHQLGLGIVGGRLYQGELEGVESARVAARILRGDPAAAFPPLFVRTGAPTYDWRELRRWGIDEGRLPPGSVVLFRQPTVWQRYRWHVTVGLAVIVAQALLIIALLVQRRRRARAERAQAQAQAEVEQKRAELAHVARVATLGELSASLAHELGQPFTAILANAAAGARFLDGPDADLREVRETFADICDDAQRAADVIHRLRAMIKRDAPPGFTRVDLNDVIRSTARIVRSDAVRHGVVVHLDLSSDVRPVAGDAVQLQQVILNLITNAFRAMGEAEAEAEADADADADPVSGGARRRRRRLDVRTRSTGGGGGADVLVEVADGGIGIAADQLERIFDPFVTTKPDGLGMGLSICRSIIERHGGKVWAANNRDRGATFSITLPAAAAAPAAPAPAATGAAV